MSLPLLFAFAIFSSAFEGGSLGRIEPVAVDHYRCALLGQADQDGRNRQASWYYFRVDAEAGQTLTIDLIDLLGEYNYNPGTHPVQPGTVPFLSYDQVNWQPIPDRQWDEARKELRLRFLVERSPVWVAHLYPYTVSDLERLAADAARSPHFAQESAGRTGQGREMPLWTITDRGVPASSKRVIWVMARQHAWESATSWVMEGMVRFLLSGEPDAVRLRTENIFRLFPLADPDGAVEGNVRFNGSGYDLNRNWDIRNPALLPEITAQRRAIEDWRKAGKPIDVFLSLHNTETAEYVTGLPAAAAPAQLQLVQRFYDTLRAESDFHPTRPPEDPGVSTTPGKPGRMTVNQALFQEMGITALLMEQMVQQNAKLGRVPLKDDRLRFGRQLALALAKAVHGGAATAR